MTARLDLTHAGRVARIRLDAPKANVLDATMVASLRAHIASLGGHDSLRVVVFEGEGAHFSFGASVEEHLPASCAAMLRGFHALILRMVELPVPILVAVRGQCLGGGLELASAGSLVFAAPDAKLGQPEIVLGVIAPAASCLLPLRIGQSAAEDLLISGRSVKADEALAMGLVNAVSDDPEAAAIAYFAAHLEGKSASSLRFAVRAARKGVVGEVKRKLAAVEELYLDDLMSTRDANEGLNAFLEKRAANWENR